MSTVATQTTRGLEVTIAHLNLIARVVAGAHTVSVDNFGEIRIQGDENALADVPATLGLERNERRDHSTDRHAYHIWEGMTSSAFGTFETVAILVEKLPVEMPADCYSAELT